MAAVEFRAWVLTLPTDEDYLRGRAAPR
jgi:hypothetical protein